MGAQVLSIVRRRRIDPLAVASLDNFRLRNDGRLIDMSVLLRDPAYSLYCLDVENRRAAFVETPAGVDLTAEPFYYRAQYHHARRIVTVSFDDLHALAAESRRRPTELILVYSVGRCGSTLLSRMFARSPTCSSISEPDVPTQLLTADLSQSDTATLLESTIRLLFQPMRRASRLLLKFRSMCVEQAHLAHRAFPRARLVFMYRHAAAVVASAMRVYRYPWAALWALDYLHRSRVGRPILASLYARHLDSWMRRYHPVLVDYEPRELSNLGAVGLHAIKWLSAMERYERHYESGLPLAAVRYESLVGPERVGVTKRLFAHCGLPLDDACGSVAALLEDSQKGSVLSRRRGRPYSMTTKDHEVIHSILSRHPTIKTPGHILPGTL